MNFERQKFVFISFTSEFNKMISYSENINCIFKNATVYSFVTSLLMPISSEDYFCNKLPEIVSLKPHFTSITPLLFNLNPCKKPKKLQINWESSQPSISFSISFLVQFEFDKKFVFARVKLIDIFDCMWAEYVSGYQPWLAFLQTQQTKNHHMYYTK